MRAADFSETTKKLLADRAGHECGLPYCSVRTVGPGAAATQTARVGQASHIYSAGVNGPRGRGGLDEDQLADADNGIWTCETHGKDIDNNKGDAFPAGLLKSWRTLHEARIRRANSGTPANAWVELIDLRRTPLFAPASKLHLGQVTVISGTNGAGKTAICEWIAGFSDQCQLTRWTGRRSRQAIDIDLHVTRGQDHVLSLEVAVGGPAQFVLANVRQPAAPRLLDVVYLSERYIGHDALDDLHGLASLFSVDATTIKALAESVGAAGNKRFRTLEFEPVPVDEGEPPVSVRDPDGAPLMQLVVETYQPAERFPLANFGGSLQTEVLLALAVELAKFKSRQAPTLLVVEAAAWGFFRDQFEAVADVIDQCSTHLQIILVEPHVRLDRAEMTAREWVQYGIMLRRPDRSSPQRIPAAIQIR